MTQRVDRWLRGERWPLVLVGLALAMSLPSLGNGPYLDDHWTRVNAATGASPWQIATADPADLAHVKDIGALSWWTSKLLYINFFRPLASVVHYLEFTLWPNAYWAMHLVNVLTYALLVWLASRVYLRLGLDARSAGLAALMFAVDDGHALTVGWICGRNTLLTGVFVFASLHAHVAARDRSPARTSLASAVYFALALSCSEGGLAGLAYLGAYALLLDPAPLRSRLRSLMPHAIVALLWLGAYVGVRAGGRGLMFYRDFATAPLTVLAHGLAELPIYVMALLGPGLAAVSTALPTAAARIGAALLSIPFVLWVVPVVRRHRLGAFFALGALLCIPPLFTTLPQDRLLILANLGAFGLIACMFQRADESGRAFDRWGKRVFVTLHIVLAPIVFLADLRGAGYMQHVHQRVFDELRDAGGQEVVVINAPSEWSNPVVFSMLYNAGVPLPASFHQLYAGGGQVEVARVGERTLELQVARGWGGNPLESLVNAEVPGVPRAGEQVSLRNLTARVLAETSEHMPAHVRFEFPSELEASGRRWYVWRDRELSRWVPPRVGESVTLAPVSVFDVIQR